MDLKSVGAYEAEGVVSASVMNLPLTSPRRLFLLARAISLALLSTCTWAADPARTCHVELWPSQQNTSEESRTAEEIARLQNEMQQLVAQLRSQIGRIAAPQERARREAELQKILSRNETELGIPPCRMGSVASQDYVREVRLRIETCGTDNFPRDNGQSLYGSVAIEFLTDRSGQLVSSSIVRRDNDPKINLHALRLIRASSPFAAVPLEMREGGYERFRYFTRFNFVHSPDDKPDAEGPRTKCTFTVSGVGASAVRPTN